MDPKKSQIDTTFGIPYDGDWMIGNKRININGDEKFTMVRPVYGL